MKEKRRHNSTFAIGGVSFSADSVFIRHREVGGRWANCVDCEKLILDYFRNTKWIPGKIGEVPVKTTDDSHVEFTIYDPNSKKAQSPFGY
jgi:hypothetical protein